ncbi:MAG: hypothetical protein Q9166_007762 [cf. Caloplaca sp. 2 TL-2023]
MNPPPRPVGGQPRPSDVPCPPLSEVTPIQRPRSETSSQRKRHRSTRVYEPSSTVSSTATSFSGTTKAQVEKLSSGRNCWHCGARKTDIAHVVGSAERDRFNKFKALGRLNLVHLHEKGNGIPLCGSCHPQFDDTSVTGFVLIPEDLQYFLREERRDMVKREKRFGRDGFVLRRQSPTAADYRDYQADEQLVGDGDHGGRYDSYVLEEYGPVGPNGPFFKTGRFVKGKVWHGDPMATLAKAFKALGDYSEYLPDTLLELSRLYQKNDIRTREMESSRPATKATDSGRDQGGQEDGGAEDSSAESSEDLEEQDSQDNEQQSLKPTKRQRPDSVGKHKRQYGLQDKLLAVLPSRLGEARDQDDPVVLRGSSRKRKRSHRRFKWSHRRLISGPQKTTQEAVDAWIAETMGSESSEVKEAVVTSPRKMILMADYHTLSTKLSGETLANTHAGGVGCRGDA